MPDFLKGIGAARAGAMAGVAAALTGFFLYVFGVITQPPEAVLFSGLETREAATVTQRLDAMNVKYDLRGDGGTIMVPADKVTQLRMQLASAGIPAEGVGYEIFDKSNTFGTTTFVQNINRLRALEGELARSIDTIDTVQSARVHLVIPDRQIFARNNQPPSASVVIRTRSQLSHEQVSAIQHLVAAAVAGLTANAVAIVDDKGDLLAGGPGDGSDADVAADQEERTAAYENRLRKRVDGIVASIVGPGHVRVQVAADMDYNRVTQSSETYDPDSRVVRSSQTVEQTSSDGGGNAAQAVSVANALPGQTPAADGGKKNGSNSSRTEETINYEISKSTKTEVMQAGKVKKLSVAVVVDGTYSKGPNGARVYAARSPQDMAKITDLVKSAVGYDQKRGDVVQVTNMKFAPIDVGPEQPLPQPLLGIDSIVWFKLGEILILSITALLVGLLIVKPMIRRLTTPVMPATAAALPAPDGASVQAVPSRNTQQANAPPQIENTPQNTPLTVPKRESMIDINQIEGQVRESSIRKVGEVVGSHPEEAMSILRTWLHQPA